MITTALVFFRYIDLSNWTSKSKVSCTTISQVYDYLNAFQINVQDPAHRCSYTWVNMQRTRKARKEVEEKIGKKHFLSREGNLTHTPHLKRQGSSPYSNIYTAQRFLASVAV